MAQGCLFDFLCLVVGNQERKVQYKTRMMTDGIRLRQTPEGMSRPLGNGVKKGFICNQCASFQLG